MQDSPTRPQPIKSLRLILVPSPKLLSGASYYACEFMQPNKIIGTYFGSKFKAETPGDSASFDQRSRRSASAAAMMMTEVKTKMIYPSLFLLPSLPCRRRWPVCLPRRSKRREGRKAFGAIHK